MTTTVHAGTPATSLVGRLNALIAAVLGCESGRVLPHARLREDLGGHPISMMYLGIAVECALGLEPAHRKPEDGWLIVADVHSFGERAAKVPA